MKRSLPQSSWITLLLYSPGIYDEVNEPIVGTVRLMKGLFLMCQEIPISSLKPYKFEPYLYGPCSFAVYRDLSNLKMKGVILEQKKGGQGYRKDLSSFYKLRYRGERRAERLWNEIPSPTKTKIRTIKTKVNDTSFLSLLRYVYNKYPKHAKNTVLPGLRE